MCPVCVVSEFREGSQNGSPPPKKNGGFVRYRYENSTKQKRCKHFTAKKRAKGFLKRRYQNGFRIRRYIYIYNMVKHFVGKTSGVCDFFFLSLDPPFRIKINQGPDDLVYLPKKMAQVVSVGWLESERGSQ